MRQANTPACLIFFFPRRFGRPISLRFHPISMIRNTISLALSVLFSAGLCTTPLLAQAPKTNSSHAAGSPPVTPEKAIALAQQGQCKEAVPALKRVMNGQGAPETRKNAGIAGLRCSLTLDNRDSALDFVRLLSSQFPQDPDVLFVLVHAYSDLSTRTAQDLGRLAPLSIPAHKLNAEALEMQGKWGEAQREYEGMIEKEPNTPGLHFLLGRLLLSKPNADPKDAERAKQEFQKEIEIDPNNSGAHYVLGELASRDENCDDAIAQFSQAAKLDPNFAEAFLGWGFCLVNQHKYEEAIAPLRNAERLAPLNASVHFTLATALSRSGQKEEAEKEFAIHRSLTTPKAPPAATQNPQ
jgi:tetratricopeptide (TPR) repeat protein